MGGNDKKERKILFSPDEPIIDSKKDVFDHKYFVNVLMYIMTNCTTPINIALYGKWGVGKSTILNFLKERITSYRRFRFFCKRKGRYARQKTLFCWMSSGGLITQAT